MTTQKRTALFKCPTCGREYVASEDLGPRCAGSPRDGSAATPHEPVAMVRGRTLTVITAPTGRFPHP